MPLFPGWWIIIRMCTSVDYRYYTGNLTQFVKEHQVDDVIFVNNASAITESRAGTMLSLFPEG